LLTRRAACAALLGALAAAACARKVEAPLPRVRVHATVSARAAQVLAEAARARRLAEVVEAAGPGDAELLWLADPAELVALGDRVADHGAPAAPGVPERFQDPRRRFAPACARAAVLLVSPAAPFPVERLSDLADPRLAGRVAIPPFTDGERTALVGALSASAGEAAASRLLAGIARNRPVLAVSDEDVPARIGRGEAWVGLASSEAAAAGAASAAGLEVVYPDQRDRGAVILPTAVAPARGSPPAALALATWLAGAEAEQLLVARVPGLVPLRDGVPVPVGVRPAMALRVVALDWDLLAEKKREARAALEGWPERWAR